MWHKITRNYSPNFSVPKRSKKTIKHIIIHYTGMKRESSAIKKLCDVNSNVSAHYFIKKNGEILNLVPDLYKAWHAGKSNWGKYKSLNKSSIGIEIHNSGHENKYENYTINQINALIRLLKILITNYNINKKNILGHSDIAPRRKQDPGEKFPWKKLSKLNLTFEHNLNDKKIKKFRFIKINEIEKKNFFQNLHKYGYNKIKNIKKSTSNKILTQAFQRRFRQSLINGIPDKECLVISKNLLKS